MSLYPWLSDDEINDLCKPLTQRAAQIRFMREELRLPVERKPNGDPLVWRADLDARREQKKPEGKRGPNRAALVAVIGRSPGT